MFSARAGDAETAGRTGEEIVRAGSRKVTAKLDVSRTRATGSRGSNRTIQTARRVDNSKAMETRDDSKFRAIDSRAANKQGLTADPRTSSDKATQTRAVNKCKATEIRGCSR